MASETKSPVESVSFRLRAHQPPVGAQRANFANEYVKGHLKIGVVK